MLKNIKIGGNENFSSIYKPCIQLADYIRFNPTQISLKRETGSRPDETKEASCGVNMYYTLITNVRKNSNKKWIEHTQRGQIHKTKL